jgi:hypothetical protein
MFSKYKTKLLFLLLQHVLVAVVLIVNSNSRRHGHVCVTIVAVEKQ